MAEREHEAAGSPRRWRLVAIVVGVAILIAALVTVIVLVAGGADTGPGSQY